MQVVGEINKQTASFSGMDVPVKIIADMETKEFRIEVGTPPVTALVKKSLSIQKGAGNPGTETVGDIPMGEVLKIIESKGDTMLSYDLAGRVKEVLGTCVSMGVKVDGKDPRQVQREIDQGMYKEALSQE